MDDVLLAGATLAFVLEEWISPVDSRRLRLAASIAAGVGTELWTGGLAAPCSLIAAM